MVNYIDNDMGDRVIAMGAPGSIARVKCERPKLIKRLDDLYCKSFDSPGRAVDRAIEMIRASGVDSQLETKSILQASLYGQEQTGSVTSLICSLIGGESL